MTITDAVKPFSDITGDVAIWIENTVTGETVSANAGKPLVAASVIKLCILAATFISFESGALDPNELREVKPEHKMPSCGALSYMHDGLKVTNLDLATLMIILSDNTATNMLIDSLGIDNINSVAASSGLEGTRLNRKLFDSDAASRGLQNYVTAESVARFFRLLLRRELVSERSSEAMLGILGKQRLNGKMPFYLNAMGVKSAHKTGEDDGISHDAGIIFTRQPLIAVFLSNNVYAPEFERRIQDCCRDLARISL